MKLARAIEGYRKLEGLTVRQMAKEIGIPHTVLWKIENGKNETTEHWPSLLRWFFSK